MIRQILGATAIVALTITTGIVAAPAKWVSVAQEKDENKTDYTEGMIGKDKDHIEHLIAPFASENQVLGGKQFDAWKAIVKDENKAKEISPEFAKDDKVKSAGSAKEKDTDEDKKALNKVCHALYKEKLADKISYDESKKEDQAIKPKYKLGQDLGMFCTKHNTPQIPSTQAAA